ncbi:MAG: hypothetical protein H6741_02805 [Alphaproteobacteria bacterium]|nr:hypothetical protein [Alphaproteobacteria bacterium]MCB9791633.1 hypothetical protein [Alphaproteobacteria bacterium]
MRRRRQGKIDIVKIVIFGGLGAAIGSVYLFAPHYYAEWKMNDVVQVTLLEWADKNKKKAEERFLRELDKREIPTYVIRDDCEFYESEGEKHIDCQWAVEVKIPLVNHWQHLEFSAHQSVNDNRNLTNWNL